MHAIYNMVGTDLDPVGSGDIRSWFRFYKWGKGKGQVYVPLEVGLEELPGIGDDLWFVMDGIILGYAPILVISTTLSSGRTEVWYDTDDVHEFRAPLRPPDTRKYWKQEEPLGGVLLVNDEEKDPLNY